jgi:hypothetical protein
MSDETSPLRGSVSDPLDPAECRALAWTAEVGRLAFTGPAGLTVRPLNFALLEGDVLLRVDAGSAFRSAQGHQVAFEIDDLDPLTRTAWSVVAEGVLDEAADGPVPDRWPVAVPGAVPLRVRVRRWSGRRLRRG